MGRGGGSLVIAAIDSATTGLAVTLIDRRCYYFSLPSMVYW
jgi:hypothetical protein